MLEGKILPRLPKSQWLRFPAEHELIKIEIQFEEALLMTAIYKRW